MTGLVWLVLCLVQVSSTTPPEELFNINQLRNLAITSDSSFKLDISVSIPIQLPSDAEVSIDLDLPIEINFMNHSIIYKPISIPYFVWPKPFEIDLSGEHNPYKYDYYPEPEDSYSPYFQQRSSRDRIVKKKRKKVKQKKLSKKEMATKEIKHHYRRHKRSLASHAAQHRSELFAIFEHTLNWYGFDGNACLCRAICEMAEVDFLIESPLHEVLEHLLR